MLSKKCVFIVFLNIILIINLLALVQCNEKPETSIKNMTEIDKAKPKPKHNDDPFKKDLRKSLRECGADVSGEADDDDDEDGEQSAEQIFPKGQQPNPGQQNANWAYENKKKSNKGTYPSHYGKNKKGGGNRSEEESEEDEDDDEYRGSSNSNRRNKGSSGNNRRNSNRKGNKNRPSHDYDDSRDRDNCEDDHRGGSGSGGSGGRKDYSSNHRNQGGYGGGSGSSSGWSSNRGGSGGSAGSGGVRYSTNMNKNYGGYSGSDPYGQKNDFGMFSGGTDMWGSRGGGSGYSVYGGRLMAMNREQGLKRTKRQHRNEEQQCMSQCVFGYLEMLDDNRVPAETEVIKYFQNKITVTAERVRLIKLTRRCFAKLSTAELSENEDGCQFSKSLATCLQIEIKNENV